MNELSTIVVVEDDAVIRSLLETDLSGESEVSG